MKVFVGIKSTVRFLLAFGTVAFTVPMSADCALAQDKSTEHRGYSYATSGILEVPNLKLLLDESNLGGKELEIAELTLPAGTVSGSTSTDQWRFCTFCLAYWITR